ncbi:MAG: sugar phosphate isomerase/epimerase [Anaerolineae bacterium]|nr:sugar phosphate isomerase/epimerase [Anaerolineae bacterium]
MHIGALDSVLTGKWNAVSWDVYYDIARRVGLDGIELGVGEKYNETDLWNSGGRHKILSLSQQSGIATSSVCLHSYWNFSFAHPDAVVRQRAKCITQEAAQLAAELGARHILIPLTCPKEVDGATARARWLEGIGSCAQAAESAGVFFCLENVGKSFGDSPEQIIDIVDTIHSPAVKVYYDPGNAVSSGFDPVRGVELYGQRIGQIHVKERDGKYLGEGRVPWREIIAALRKVGYDGWLILETNPTEDPEAAAARNLKVLRELVSAHEETISEL